MPTHSLARRRGAPLPPHASSLAIPSWRAAAVRSPDARLSFERVESVVALGGVAAAVGPGEPIQPAARVPRIDPSDDHAVLSEPGEGMPYGPRRERHHRRDLARGALPFAPEDRPYAPGTPVLSLALLSTICDMRAFPLAAHVMVSVAGCYMEPGLWGSASNPQTGEQSLAQTVGFGVVPLRMAPV